MLIPSYSRVAVSELVAGPARVLIRCLSREEVAVVTADGQLPYPVGTELVAVVPMVVYRELLRGKVYPAHGSSERSWDEIDTGLAPPDPGPR